MKRLESYTENRVVAWARRRGVLTTKLKIEGQAGWPDRCFWFPLPEGPVIMELKRRGEKPRKLQNFIMLTLKSMGYDITWTDNEDEAISYLEKRLARHTQAPQVPKARRGVAG